MPRYSLELDECAFFNNKGQKYLNQAVQRLADEIDQETLKNLSRNYLKMVEEMS